jgi:parallel beta-helix repeat protein
MHRRRQLAVAGAVVAVPAVVATVVMAGISPASAVAAAALPAVPAAKASPTYSVAVGGSIQAAVDQAAAAGGGTVTLASGTHNITSPVLLRSGVTLQGQGQSGTALTTIHNSAGTNMIVMLDGRDGGLSNVIIRQLKVDCALSATQRQYTSDPGKNYGAYITDNKASNDRVLVDNVQITACAVGLHSKGTTNLTIRNSNIHHNGGWPTYFHNVYLRRVSKADIQNTIMSDSTGGNGINISYSDNITVRNCTVSGNGFRGVRAAESTYIDVLANTVANNEDAGIVINSEANGVQHFRIHGNAVTGNRVGIATTSNSSDGEVWNNTVSGNSTNLDIKSATTSIQ